MDIRIGHETAAWDAAHRGPTVLVTGASGVAGRVVAAGLIERGLSGADKLNVVAVGQRQPRHTDNGTRPAAPMSKGRLSDYEPQACQVSAVVHLALDPPYVGPGRTDFRTLNEAVAFARLARAPFYYVTSAFGADARVSRGENHGLLASAGDPTCPAWFDDQPSTIVRTSLVVGHSRTGAINGFPAIYQFLAALLDGSLSPIAFNPDWRMDCIPYDVIATVVSKLVANKITYWDVGLTGGEAALTLRQVRKIASEVQGAATPAAESPPVDIARRAQQRYFSAVLHRFAARHAHCEPLDSFLGNRFQNAISELGMLGLQPPPSPRETLMTCLRYVSVTTSVSRTHSKLAPATI